MNREELFDKFLQRSLSEAEARTLKRLLQEDPKSGRQLVHHVTEAALVVRVGSQLVQSQLAPSQLIPAELAPPVGPAASGSATTAAAGTTIAIVSLPAPTAARRTSRRWWLMGAAAGLLALAAVGRLFLPGPVALHAALSMGVGDVAVLRGDRTIASEPGLMLQQGDIVQTGPQGRAVVVFEGEATRLELQSDSRIHLSATRKGKRVQLLHGVLEGSVATQPKGRLLTCETLHALARIRGTHFLLASEVSSTRLEVTEGAVEFIRQSDGQSLLVRQGCSAVASPNVEFAVRPFLPEPWKSQDIGAVGLHGQGRFDGRHFRLRGAGQDTCSTKDQLQFTHQPLLGDGEIIACVRDIEFTDPEAKAMVMIRQALKSASAQVSLGVTAAGGLEVEQRAGPETTLQRVGHAGSPRWLRLVRSGPVIAAYHSGNGSDWTPAGTFTNAMPAPVFIGIGVTSYNHAALSTALFDEVRVVASR